MSTHEEETVKDAVRTRYAESAVTKTSCCGSGGSCCARNQTGAPVAASLYDPAALAALPADADLGLGCGDPLAMESLEAGEVVVDLGSGGGIDCFLAARRVGPTGRVIGVYMTPEMVGLAWENASRGGFDNVEFVLGEIESLPVDDGTADMVISNCVINLVPNKQRAFAEAFRATKPGGRLSVSDVVTIGPLPQAVRTSAAAYVACLGGASTRDEYLAAIEAAGYTDVRVMSDHAYAADEEESGAILDAMTGEQLSDMGDAELGRVAKLFRSVTVHAVRPA
jgi:SAM-dependent methyltransferase